MKLAFCFAMICMLLVPLMAGAVVIFHDDFDGPLEPTWRIQRGDAWIEDGWVVCHDQGGGPYRDTFIVTAEDTCWDNYQVTMRFYAEGGGDDWYNGRVLLRVQDISGWHHGHFYDVSVSTPLWTGGVSVNLVKRIDDQAIYLEHVVPPPGVVNDYDNTVEVEVCYARILVWVNGHQVMDFTDPEPILTGGIGLGCVWESRTRFDYVTVEGCSPTATEASSWGQIKALYR